VADKLDILEAKVLLVLEKLQTLRKENERLRSECDTLKSQMSLMHGESRKAQRVLAEYDQLKRNQEQAATRVERALQKLNSLRVA
jgi:predicted RNase H-like nuclease (RuvC/YqgF family)